MICTDCKQEITGAFSGTIGTGGVQCAKCRPKRVTRPALSEQLGLTDQLQPATNISAEALLRAARNPIVDDALARYDRGDIDYIQALERIAVQQQALTTKLRDATQGTSPSPWVVRTMCSECFVESPKQPGEAYGIEILGDEDYETKRADAEFVATARALADELANF